ncbi:hypothetical protein [Nocardia brevicatena]|uniref:hypothetical protein n=1 Tax=Nocardia brevicatena TaxID=37327 RepID=UPI0012F73453|nr:hypothetical protein [Nocardia brevicatena]
MSWIAHLAREMTRHTSNLLGRAGASVATRYRADRDKLRGVASGAINADHQDASRILWKRVSRIVWPITAAAWGDFLLVSDSTEGQLPELYEGPVEEVAALVGMSPTLTENLRELDADGWIIRWGPKDSLSSTDGEGKVINIDIGVRGNDKELAAILAHETGHARKSSETVYHPGMPPQKGMSRVQWIKEQIYFSFLNEAAAQMVSAQVRQEILDNDGPDIPLDDAAKGAYNSYIAGEISRQEARIKIADSMNNPRNGWYLYYYGFYQEKSKEYFGG